MVSTEHRTTSPSEQGHVFSLESFSARHWLLLIGTALTWGSSFVWIEVALDTLAPTFIAFLRLLLGAGTLVFFRKARAPVERKDLPAIAALGVLWMGAPFILFPIAQQWIDSSLAGMINGGVPIVAGLVAAIMLRRPPPTKTIAGIAIGFLGVLAVGWPALQGSQATALGAALVVLATTFYGIAINIAVPLQRKYGSLPVLLRTQLFALAVTVVPGLFGLSDSSLSWTSLGAVVPLGCLGTGLAFVWMATLVGGVGAARGSITIYFVPVVAIVLGAVFRSETISAISLGGTVMVLGGAFLATTAQTASTREPSAAR